MPGETRAEEYNCILQYHTTFSLSFYSKLAIYKLIDICLELPAVFFIKSFLNSFYLADYIWLKLPAIFSIMYRV